MTNFLFQFLAVESKALKLVSNSNQAMSDYEKMFFSIGRSGVKRVKNHFQVEPSHVWTWKKFFGIVVDFITSLVFFDFRVNPWEAIHFFGKVFFFKFFLAHQVDSRWKIAIEWFLTFIRTEITNINSNLSEHVAIFHVIWSIFFHIFS